MRTTLWIPSRGRAGPLVRLAVGSLFLACASAGGPPAWVERPDADYPEMSYLTAVGSGEDLAAASAQATAGIMQIFVSNVDQTLSDRQASRVEGGRQVQESDIELRTVIESSGAIEGVQIKHNWRDRGAKRHYALAVLDKDAAREALGDRLAGADADLARALSVANESATPLERAGRLARTIEAANERDILAAQYRVLGAGAWRGLPDTSSLRAARDRARDAVVFAVDARLLDLASGAETPLTGVRKSLAQTLSDAGFKVDAGGEASMRLTCVIELSEPFERGRARYTHHTWAGSVELGGGDAGSDALLVYKSEGSASHGTPELARKRALIDAEETIVPGFRRRLQSYLAQAE